MIFDNKNMLKAFFFIFLFFSIFIAIVGFFSL